jgi:hypothetical protein
MKLEGPSIRINAEPLMLIAPSEPEPEPKPEPQPRRPVAQHSPARH